jgi:hypothetical protein
MNLLSLGADILNPNMPLTIFYSSWSASVVLNLLSIEKNTYVEMRHFPTFAYVTGLTKCHVDVT